MTRRFGVVKVFAFGAVKFHRLRERDVGHSGREEWVGAAVYAGAFSEIAFFIFLELGKESGQYAVALWDDESWCRLSRIFSSFSPCLERRLFDRMEFRATHHLC